MKHLVIILTVAIISGCASYVSSSAIGELEPGMTKSKVISILGKPDSVSRKMETEYLLYMKCISGCYLLNTSFHKKKEYYVLIKNGKVESFGYKGDFDTTATPTTRIKKDIRIEHVGNQKIDINSTDKKDLYTELMKLKELKDSGILTQEEFDIQKKKLLDK